MKIAICYYGLVGSSNFKYGKGSSLDPEIAYNSHKKFLFDNKYNIDIFIHSQSFDQKEILIDLYNPKEYFIEKQKNFFFQTLFHKEVINNFLSIPFKIFKRNENFKSVSEKLRKTFLRCKNSRSRWYSTKKVVDLKRKYEKKMGFNYDLVMLTRLDVGFFSKFDFDTLPKEKLTVSNHNDVPAPRNNYKQEVLKNNRTEERGISDFWFISSSKKIDNFASLYDNFNRYSISPHVSSYQHTKKNNIELNFYKYRSIDHEVIRRINKSSE